MDDRKLLHMLSAGPRAGAELAAALAVAPEALAQACARLQAAGAALVASADGTWQLLQPLDLHNAQAVRDRLSGPVQQALSRLEVVWEVDSTNSALLREPAPDDGVAVLLAETQQAGRGRRGRVWVSPLARHLYLSLCWRAPHGLAALAGLSVVVGVVVAEVLRDLGLARVGLKWPNDLLLDGAKLGGILVETAGPARGPLQVVLGLGLNVHGTAWEGEGIEQPWAALDACLDPVPHRDALAAALIQALVPAMVQYRQQGLAPFLSRYAALDILAGQPIWVDQAGGRVPAVASGLAEDGALRVRDGQGERRLHAGMVSVRTQ